MSFHRIAALYRELKNDAIVVLIEPVAQPWLQARESVVDVVGNVIENGTVGVAAAECKQMWLPALWIDGLLGGPVVAQPDVGDVWTGIGWYGLTFFVELVERLALWRHLGSFCLTGDGGVI